MTTLNYAGTELDVFKSAINWKNYWAARINPYIHGQVLEVGAGIGSSTLALQNSEHTQWTCLEPDRDLAAKLTQRLLAENVKGEYRVISETLSEFEDHDLYDTILYLDVLEHIEDDSAELMHAARRLNNSGHLIILAPAHQFLFSNFDQAIGHYRRYNRKTLLDAAPKEMTLLQAKYLDSAGLLVSLGNRLLLHADAPKQYQINFWDNVLIPISRITDPLLLNKLGKSILAIWRKDLSAAEPA